ncbi:SDR family oxidoreductase [Tenggerimyces flavus]|uniref:SDR family oxidoreductase n=1 Tax=Tenggerimyces flavus TaxID=1708749 RepID=A0ABV7YLG6_9ACTN|nr:SDR family oxidoreductase [Tenggerimyces flavus]MBM7787639.1 NAD(P)-dependent dehydrogenase (short-subunit alcohol dehydrogenase family) [Tenggerimyces flavus]
MLLADKIAIVYGGGPAAAALAQQGAAVHVVVRASLDQALAGVATTTVLDVFDEEAVAAHVRTVVDRAGGVDVAVCLVERGDVLGLRLLDMTVADFTRPLFVGVTSTFVTARAVARQMVRQRSGLIVASHGPGGSGVASAATDALLRDLAGELAPYGVRVRAASADEIESSAVALTTR